MYDCNLTEHSSGGVALLTEERPQEVREDKVRDLRRLIRQGRYRVSDRLEGVAEMLMRLYGG